MRTFVRMVSNDGNYIFITGSEERSKMVSAVTNLGANAAKRYLDINSAKSTRATEELASGLRASNPSYDPSSSAVGYSLTANVQSLGQASRNVAQATAMIQMATGTLGATADVLTRMKEITVSANSDTVGASQRSMMDQEFQQLANQIDRNANSARWGGNSLFAGSVGATTHNGSISQSESGLTAQANAFAASINATSRGFINGTASGATVVAEGSLYNVSITVGNQTFQNIVSAPVAGGTLALVSTSNSNNVIVLDYDAAPVTGITNATTFQSNLRALLGVNATSGGTATFYSLSSNAAVSTSGSMTVTGGAGTTAGTWALTYTGASAGGTGTFSISNGIENYSQTVSNTSTNAMAQTVSFSNGLTVALTNAFDGTANVAQETYVVAAGTAVTQNFQYAEKASDILSVSFNGAGTAALGLVGANVTTKANAVSASGILDSALNQIETQIAQLGGKASQLNFMSDTLMISIQNQTAARGAFVDANIADSMLSLQRFKGLGAMAGTVFTQSLNAQREMTQMVQSVQ